MLACFVLALLLRLGAVVTFGDRELAYEWAVIVPSMLAGQGYSYYHINSANQVVPEFVDRPGAALPSAYMPPAYGFFLAGLGLIVGLGRAGVIAMEIIQAALGAGSCVLLYQIARSKFSPGVGLASGLLLAVYPLAVYASSQISAATLYVFLNCLLLWLLFRCEGLNRRRDYVLAGLALGTLILARAEMLLFVPLVVIWLRMVQPQRYYRNAAYLLLATGVVIGPWAARNWYVFGRPAPLTISAGINLWEGQNPNATGTRSEYTNPPVAKPPELIAALNALPATRDYELKADSVLRDAALRAMLDNPWRSARLALRKLVFYWGYYWGIPFSYPSAQSPLYWLPWFLLLPTFLIGLSASARQWRRYSLFYLYFGFTTCIVMVFFVIPRYSLLILPLVIPFAVYGATVAGHRVSTWWSTSAARGSPR
jgi:4-amino-4-deoxy-L-arabinose transferase-like glycosyltransferase